MRRFRLAFFLTLCALISACGPSSPAAPPASSGAPTTAAAPAAEAPATESASGKGVIAFSQGDLGNEWRVVNNNDMERAVKEAGYEFIWADAKADPAKQLADVEDLLAKQPDLLVIAPVEYEPLAPVVDMAARADVPLLVIDRAIPGTPGQGQWISLITIDFVETGRLVAEDLVEELTKKHGTAKGKVLHITGNIGASPVIDMQKGIDEVLAQHPEVEIVASCDGRYQREAGRKCMEDLLQKYPAGEIDAVIADNDEIVLGALQAAKAAGREELVGWIWGKDGTKSGLEALLAGEMNMTVQTPPTFGDLTIKAFEQWKAGQPVEPLQFVPKERFDNDSDAERARLQERIKELDAMGVGCC
jgi:ABC-type sugar transport system substrate-binding protein